MLTLSQVLKFIHHSAVTFWIGSAAAAIILEYTLWRARTAVKQRTLIELRHQIDFIVQGPAIITALVTGVLLLWRRGYLEDTKKWPDWFEDKLICASLLALAHVVGIIFAYLRARNAEEIIGNNAPPLEFSFIKRWHIGVTFTMFSLPFGIIAIWIIQTKGHY